MSSLKIRPLRNKILVKPIKEEEYKTDGGIIIPITVAREMQYAKVQAIGSEVDTLVSVDDTVVFPKGTGIKEEYNREQYIFVQAEDLWAIV